MSRRSWRAWRSIENFFRIEAASGIVLLCATATALAWANSPWRASYELLWQSPLEWGFAHHAWRTTLRLVVNDGLMTIFFLVVGLEIRTEIHHGELSTRKRAIVPVMAAAGGVITPALLYLAIAAPHGLGRGWAIPTATDIAFAVGVLTLLGSRVSPSARVLLLALAVIDDVAAVLVIAFFYSAEIRTAGLLVGAVGVALVLLLHRVRVRAAVVYFVPAVILWLGLLQAGVHPTLAGVILGLLTPSGTRSVRRRRSGSATDGVLSPAQGVQRALHPWVAFGIMPLFALSNAGIAFDSLAPALPAATALTWAIAMALVIGKPLGITVFTWATTRSGLGEVSGDLTWRELLLVGCLGGIGFTMSLFLTNLAFIDPVLTMAGKSAVLLGSAVAAAVGILAGRFALFPDGRS